MKPEDLLKSSEHLHYEITMMQGCFQLLQNDYGSTFMRYTLLESFLIHTRVICAFLFGFRSKQKPRLQYQAGSKDVIAKDYFDDPNRWNPKPNAFLDKTCDRINGALAHLSEERLNAKEPWEILRIYNDLMPQLREFRQLTPNSRLDARLNDLDLSAMPVSVRIVATNTSVMISSPPQIQNDKND